MTITRNPKKKPASISEATANKFIKGSANGAGRQLVPVLIKFERGFLDRLDLQARNRGLNRTAFVISTLGDRIAELELMAGKI
ncbi:MAG TPA: hypothetical protein VL498_06865 [Terracidiphilus sp.]|jgi:hypothetical protein|nr:hypothetical protein [Terracidiphilus sp.]